MISKDANKGILGKVVLIYVIALFSINFCILNYSYGLSTRMRIK